MTNSEKRILFIEDDRKFGQAFYETLKEEGYYVVWQNRTEGAQYWATHRDLHWDMILSDQRMPGELGADFFRFLSEVEKCDPRTLDSRSPLYRELRKQFSDLDEEEFQKHLCDLQAHPSLRVILSGYAEDDGIKRGLESGVIHKYIFKPIGTDKILTIIRDLFEQYKR